jgi:hypothetical protein
MADQAQRTFPPEFKIEEKLKAALESTEPPNAHQAHFVDAARRALAVLACRSADIHNLDIGCYAPFWNITLYVTVRSPFDATQLRRGELTQIFEHNKVCWSSWLESSQFTSKNYDEEYLGGFVDLVGLDGRVL